MLDLYERGDVKAEIFYFEKFKIGKYTRILDIGANSGPFINSLHTIGYLNIFGIDINEDAVNEGLRCYQNISDNLQIYDGKRIPFADEAFGVVTMFDVLEHIPANDIK
jgi:2-polyprenyl-3-methyl-5-hydroxy-6-metoxy-1,4-benzoquinol methylase